MIVLVALAALAGDHVVVRTGDSVDDLAAAAGTTAAALRDANGVKGRVRPGTILLVPPRPGEPVGAGALCSATGTGSVTLPTGPGQFAAGALLPEGSRVCTAADSYATVCLARSDGGFESDNVSLYPRTCLVVDRVFTGPGGRRSSLVTVDQGDVAVRYKPEVASGDVTVRTAASVASGRRGGYRVAVEPSRTRVEAVQGAVSVLAEGAQVDLAPGEGVATEVGSAPGAKHDLLTGGEGLVRPAEGKALRRPEFSWHPVDSALGYQVELASTPDFVDLVTVRRVGSTEWTPDRLFLPFRIPGLWWRVAAVDRMGFVGVPTVGRALRLPTGIGP